MPRIQRRVASDTPARHEAGFHCPNCQTQGRGHFCSACGQKRPHEADLSIAHVWHHVLHETLHLDGRIFSTLKLLFLRPGQLTLDFLEGRRERHVPPLRLFLVFSAIYFLADVQVFGPAGVLHHSRYTTSFEQSMTRKAQREGVSYETVVARVERRAHVAFKAAFISTVIFNGAVFWLFFRRKRAYLAEHMVTALHWSCVAMTLSMVLGLLGQRLRLEAIFSGVATGLLIEYGRQALQRVYGREHPFRMVLSLLMGTVGDFLMLGGVTLLVIWMSIR